MSRHATKLTLTALLSGAILATGLSGCNRTQSTETLLAEATNYQQKGDIKAALIQLKNAVANSPENGEAHMALGTLQLSTGDAVSAKLVLENLVLHVQLLRRHGLPVGEHVDALLQRLRGGPGSDDE